jgi:hypothetical protein
MLLVLDAGEETSRHARSEVERSVSERKLGLREINYGRGNAWRGPDPGGERCESPELAGSQEWVVGRLKGRGNEVAAVEPKDQIEGALPLPTFQARINGISHHRRSLRENGKLLQEEAAEKRMEFIPPLRIRDEAKVTRSIEKDGCVLGNRHESLRLEVWR